MVYCPPFPQSQDRNHVLPSDIDELSNEEIIELQENSSRLLPDYDVFQLTPATVAKASEDINEAAPDCSEANALDLVFAKTTIPVPRVRRVVKRGHFYLIVMDYIKGQALSDLWKDLSIWRKLAIAFTLRRYVRQLRRLKASPSMPPGPLSAYAPRICESPIFGQVRSRRGPFASYSEFSAFFNDRHRMALDIAHIPKDRPSWRDLFDDSEPLVLTHQDLNPRNIILGEDGRLWIVDWAWAGYYPPCFEYVAMLTQAENEEMLGYNHVLWETLIPFICGPYFYQRKWLWNLMPAMAYG
ncbi:hypothetical protein CERSUDRAFT_115059 [Gelatoporia subvermispora B]|uniref:Aminoglycoside phosphotransferase domain-containing protein n=1 Tax=Ceriporiopsis subvermispora (strain B) TaxID=914234 RepID=M2PLD2_CERS8|nr:hypothetical protein CERSUDRAFT_115059 [Gelatoporia subvermispora B]